jgi:hypothetical protein
VDVNTREVRPVVDPALAPRTQRWLRRLIARKAHPADKLPAEYIGPLALSSCLLGALVSGLAGPWLCATAVSIIATFAAHHEIDSGGLHRHRRRFVDPSALDTACRGPLQAAQRAIDAVLESEVYEAGMLDHAARAVDLRRHEWEIACRLRDITSLRAAYTRSMSAGVPGPQTAAVLSAHLRAITIAQDATTRRVAELQRYSDEVMAADVALRDWQTAEHVARRNDIYLDLVASSEADEHAIAEITCLTEHAVRTRDAFQATLDQAALAAQPLVFSDTVHGTLGGAAGE